jgi:hypothetical protein
MASAVVMNWAAEARGFFALRHFVHLKVVDVPVVPARDFKRRLGKTWSLSRRCSQLWERGLPSMP